MKKLTIVSIISILCMIATPVMAQDQMPVSGTPYAVAVISEAVSFDSVESSSQRRLAIGYDDGLSLRAFLTPRLALEFGLSAVSLFSSSDPYQYDDDFDSFQYSIRTFGNVVFPFGIADTTTLNLVFGGGREWETTYTDEPGEDKTYEGDSFYLHLPLGTEIFISDRLSFEPRFGIGTKLSSVYYMSGDHKFSISDYDFMRVHFLSHMTFRWYF